MVKMVITLPNKPEVEIDLLSLRFDYRVRVSNIDKNLLRSLHKALKSKSLKENKTLKAKFKEILPNTSFSTFYDWINKRIAIPLYALKTLLLELTEKGKIKILNEINKTTLFSAGGDKFTSLPRRLNPQLAYLLGCLHGDGSLHKEYGVITVTSGEKEYLVKVVGPLFKQLFNTDYEIRKCSWASAYRLTVCGVVLHSFLSNFCPIGKKKNKLKIPPVIKNNEILLKWYLGGLFDTDGSLTKIIPHLDSFYSLSFNFIQSSKDFVFDVFDSLIKLGIPIKKPRLIIATHPDNKNIKIKEWRVQAHSKKTLLPLLRQIEVLHPYKIKRKQWILDSYQRFSKTIT